MPIVPAQDCLCGGPSQPSLVHFADLETVTETGSADINHNSFRVRESFRPWGAEMPLDSPPPKFTIGVLDVKYALHGGTSAENLFLNADPT
jgi:hypothetical protein